MANIFDSNGYLPPGFQDWTLSQVKCLLVEEFTESRTRKDIFDGYIELVKVLTVFNITVEQWLDGSFGTCKKDPNDLDMLTLLDKDFIDNLPDDVKQVLSSIFSGPDTKAKYKCDSYCIPSVPKSHPHYSECLTMKKYWMGQFGFDRNDVPKGIIRVIVSSDDNLLMGSKGDAQ